jgi:hypothetical protein
MTRSQLLALRRTFADRRDMERAFMVDAYIGFFLLGCCIAAAIYGGSVFFRALGI